MLKTDPLSFLDEFEEASVPVKKKGDVLSFLDETKEQQQPSNDVAREENGSADLLSFLDEPKEPFYKKYIPKFKEPNGKSLRQNIIDINMPEEKTPEQLKAMTLDERMEYAQDLKNFVSFNKDLDY